MCIKPKTPDITPTPNVVTATDSAVGAQRDERVRLGQNSGGRLATRLMLGTSDNRVKLGG